MIAYVAGYDANFFEVRDALYFASTQAIETGEEQIVMVDDGDQTPYIYARIRKGQQE